MEIVVFAEQFRSGSWDVWEHTCSPKEIEAVVDCALVRARVRSSNGRPTHDDFLEGARCAFDLAHGSANRPKDGDIRVYCVCVDRVVIGVYEKILQYSQQVAGAHEYVEVALQQTA